MARRHGTWEAATKAAPTVASIEAHLASGNLAAAAVAARKLYQAYPSFDHCALLQRILIAQANLAIDANDRGEFERIVRQSEVLSTDDAQWSVERAVLLAKWGLLPQAFMALPETAGEPERRLLLAHASDRAIRHKSYANLPEEHHESFKAVIVAFAKYERGEDDAARELLQSVGLQSPFLDWKLLLRGLIAFTANDDAKVLENWKRLDLQRLPWRLVAPLAMKLDPSFRIAKTPWESSRIQIAGRRLRGTKLHQTLAEISKSLAQSASLSSVWPYIQNAWAGLKPTHSDLADRLARCIYQTIIRQGQPNDLPMYRQIFGPPADDPEFHRLHATALESHDQFARAIGFWEKYERWLGTKPPQWPEDQRRRARALVLQRLAALCEQARTGRQETPLDFLFARDAEPKPKKSPGVYHHAAILADPTAFEPRLAYVKYLAKGADRDALLAAAHEALTLEPGHVELLTLLGNALQATPRVAEAFEFRKRALAANPLDRTLAVLTVQCGLAAARRVMIECQIADGEQLLVDNNKLFSEHDELGLLLLQCTLARKAGRRAEADDLRERCFAKPNSRLAVALTLSADAVLANLKTTEKTVANKRLTEALTQPARPRELALLQRAVHSFAVNGFEFRGSKTLPKKIEKLFESISKLDLPRDELHVFLTSLESTGNPRFIRKIARTLKPRHPREPRICILIAQSYFGEFHNWQNIDRARMQLLLAKKLIEANDTDGELLARIEALESELPESLDFSRIFDAFGR